MKSRSAIVLAPFAAVLLAGCAQNGTLTTGSLNPSVVDEEQAKQVAANKQACASLAAQIEGLNKDGVADKVAKAAAKKYKMKTADLAKASELNKAHAEFQAKCSNYPMESVATAPETAPADAKAKAMTPPVPPRKTAAEAATPAKPQVKQASAQPKQAPSAAQAAAPVTAAASAAAKQAATKQAEAKQVETKQASAEPQQSASAESQGPFAAPRLSVAPGAVTTTSTP